jgi:hypothetical protein
VPTVRLLVKAAELAVGETSLDYEESVSAS